jgi:hypothetical protein
MPQGFNFKAGFAAAAADDDDDYYCTITIMPIAG